MNNLSCFKAYDIRGKLDEELDEALAYRIAQAFAAELAARKVVIGGDIRLSTPAIKQAMIKGLLDMGVAVLDLGLTGTEEIYFAAAHLDACGGIEVTASHNPADYNGIKLVGRAATPLSEPCFAAIKQRCAANDAAMHAVLSGSHQQIDLMPAYIDKLLSFIDPQAIKPLTLVANAGNGAAGHVLDALEQRFAEIQLPIRLIKLLNEPDGHFPHGVPNPLLPENRAMTADAVRQHQADFGIAWDGDFDRCFLFDERGEFIEGYYIVGLLAEAILKHQPGATIIHDPRLIWNTQEIVSQAGGKPLQSRTGHGFIKQIMREHDAAYGGEMSAHHYFRDFACCDSGMIPWLMVAELVSRSGQPLSSLVGARMQRFPASGEINRKIANSAEVLVKIREQYQSVALEIDETDGLSVDLGKWRFNLRRSNTEPLIRLNVESRQDETLMRLKTQELLDLLVQYGNAAN